MTGILQHSARLASKPFVFESANSAETNAIHHCLQEALFPAILEMMPCIILTCDVTAGSFLVITFALNYIYF